MHKEILFGRDLVSEIFQSLNNNQIFSDIHIEQDSPIMYKSPRGWRQGSASPVTLKDMTPLLKAIDEDWEDKILIGAIDRRFVLTASQLRCNIYRLASGAKVTISIRRLPIEPVTLDKTGLPIYVKSMLEPTKGIILVTGPTGSGKTTTIASMLDHLNTTRNAHIITIEEPIEYVLERKQSILSQKEVPTDTPSFSTGLREAMRQKPDILMVGEIRDFDTADTVLHAGESGHLVLATMHTNNAISAITKLLGFFPQEQRAQRAASLSEALVGIIYQHLLPNENGDDFVLASEMIFNNNNQATPYINDLGKVHMLADFMKTKQDNMSRTLNDSLVQLVTKKLVTSKDAMRAAYDRLELHDMLNGKR